MKINTPFLVLSFFISLGLVVISDMPLNGMLGDHPLQSELTFVEGHVKEVEKEKSQKQAHQQQKEEEVKDTSQEELLYFGIFAATMAVLLLLSLSSWQIYLGLKKRKSVTVDRDSKLAGSSILGLMNVMMCCGLFFILTGTVYIFEGRLGAQEMEPSVQDVILRKKQNRRLSEEQKIREQLVLQIYRHDQDRENKGYMFAILGVLALCGAWGSGRLKPIK